MPISPPLSPSPLLALTATNLARAGFPHGFSTRLGGVSGGAFASLNFDAGAGDASANVSENVRRFAAAVGFEPAALRQVTQVHGARVLDADRDLADAQAREEADALVLAPQAASGARAVGIRVADCVPVLVAARGSGAVAAVHAGWRGVVAEIVLRAAERLAAGGGGELVAAVGPCIGACCFEVGGDVAAQVAAASEAGVVVRTVGAKAYVDLRRAVEVQLRRAGVHDVEQVPGCTVCDAGRFFSFRRDGKESGRHLAAIALRP